jgi:hypothetical protein
MNPTGFLNRVNNQSLVRYRRNGAYTYSGQSSYCRNPLRKSPMVMWNNEEKDK